jgi:hypothetical protein
MADARALTLDELGKLEPPQRGPDGKTTIEHLRWKAQVVTQLMTDAALGRAELPKGYNAAQARELIDTEARLCGYDPKHLLDVRTEAQVYADATKELIEAPQTIFEKADDVIDQIGVQMDKADEYLNDICGQTGPDARAHRGDKEHQKHLERVDALKKVWRERIAKLKRIRERARDAFPQKSAQPNRCAITAAHPLRFMVYVGRNEDGAVAIIGKHHGDLAFSLYEAEFRKHWRKTERDWIKWDYTGCVDVIGPGHGKSFFASHWCALRHAQYPNLRGKFGHAQAGMAELNLQFVSSMFSRGTAQGRRLRSLFPATPEVRKSTTDVFDLEPVGGEKRRTPSITAHGITAKISGSDADYIWFDDPCDQELAEQETTRTRVFDRMNGTWRRRLREKPSGDGHWPFELTTTTLWHHDDPNSRRIKMAKDKKIKLRVKLIPCGGPDENFRPVWPEVWPERKLRVIYTEMRNPRLYAATYQCNPQPDSLRKIKRLAYYLPGSEEHAAFMQNCIFHTTIDPTGTNSDKSDHASFLYAGCGDIVAKHPDGSMSYTRKLRMIDGREFHAGQSETVQEVCSHAETHSTHYIHCELVSGYEAMREFFEQRDIDVIGHQPHGKSKEVRLGHVASMFDDSMRDRGFPGAVIEWPGKLMPDGTIGPDPESPLAFAEDQFLNFGVAKGDHAVDAGVYLAKHLGPELNVAEGAITKTLQKQQPQHPDPRVDRMLRMFGTEPDKRRTAGQEEHEFMVGTGEQEWN